MAGITDAEFAMKLIPYGFDTVTIGGYNLDAPSIEACRKIIERGRKEFNYPQEEVIGIIEHETDAIKGGFDVAVSANLRSASPQPVIEASRIPSLDIVEINCHCRQEELTQAGCGQAMLLRDDLEDYVRQVTRNARSKVSLKMRANVDGVDNLEIAKIAEDAKVDYLHVDAMKKGVFDADFDLIREIANETSLFIIGNNSVNSKEQAQKMLDCGAKGFSIARAALKGRLDFDISDL